MLDAGFEENWYTDVITNETKKNFSALYNVQGNLNIIVKHRKSIKCPKNESFKISPWNVITSVIKYIASRKDKSQNVNSLEVLAAVWGNYLLELRDIYQLLISKAEIVDDENDETKVFLEKFRLREAIMVNVKKSIERFMDALKTESERMGSSLTHYQLDNIISIPGFMYWRRNEKK